MGNLKGLELINEVFIAKNDYAEYIEEHEELTIYDCRKGEKLKVLEYDEETKEYKLLNLSLGVNEAWFIVNEEIFNHIFGRDTKMKKFKNN